jgi:hypothetical protein
VGFLRTLAWIASILLIASGSTAFAGQKFFKNELGREVIVAYLSQTGKMAAIYLKNDTVRNISVERDGEFPAAIYVIYVDRAGSGTDTVKCFTHADIDHIENDYYVIDKKGITSSDEMNHAN